MMGVCMFKKGNIKPYWSYKLHYKIPADTEPKYFHTLIKMQLMEIVRFKWLFFNILSLECIKMYLQLQK